MALLHGLHEGVMVKEYIPKLYIYYSTIRVMPFNLTVDSEALTIKFDQSSLIFIYVMTMKEP